MPKRGAFVAGALALLFYVAPAFVPPGAMPATPPLPDVSIVARLFPGVPEWWVVLRLSALALGAVLVAWAGAARALGGAPAEPAADRATEDGRGESTEAQGEPSTAVRRMLGAALLSALALTAAVFFAPSWGRQGQLAYLAAFAVPLVLAFLSQRRAFPERRRGFVGPGRSAVAVAVLGASYRLAQSVGSDRIADTVDGWAGLECLRRGANPGFNVITDACYVGYSALPILPQGIGLWPEEISFPLLQALHVGWLAATALLLATVARRAFGAAVGPVAAPVTAATFLAAPWTARVPLMATADFVFALYTAALLVAVTAFRRTGSWPALVSAGFVAGFALRCPPLAAVVVVTGLYACADRKTLRGVPAAVVATAVLSAVATALHGLPGIEALASMTASYGSGSVAWATMEQALLGQVWVPALESATRWTEAGPLDVTVGTALAPFAVPRTAIRLWGDTALDPLGAALAAVGLVSTLIASVRRPALLWIPVLVVAALLPGVVSSYDRPSLTRAFAAVAPLALSAGVGAAVLARALTTAARSLSFAAALSVAVLVAGALIFDAVNPRILARSSAGIALAAVGERSGWLVSESLMDPVATELIASSSGGALRVVPALDAVSLLAAVDRTGERSNGDPVRDFTDGSARSLLFWSPGVEERYAFSGRLCERRPSARILRLYDRSGISAAFAVSVGSEAIRPNWPAERTEESGCPTRFATGAARAIAVREEARRFRVEGRDGDASRLLASAAASSVARAGLYADTAAALLGIGSEHPEVLPEALHWARGACISTGRRDPRPCLLVARVHAAAGRFGAAVAAARLAKDAAFARGHDQMAAEIEAAIAEYTLGR